LLCRGWGLGFSGVPDGLQYSSQDYVLLMEKGSVQRRGFDRALYIADRLNSDQ
jgi:hypothetical protein